MTAAPIEDLYPLSPMQQGLLLHSLYDAVPGLYCEQVIGEARDLDRDAFRSAWQAVLDREAVLRTGFVWEEVDQPLQVVLGEVGLPLEEHHWEDLRQAEQDRRLQALLDAERVRGFDLTTPPLLRLALLHLGRGRQRFVLTFHHLLLDGWSLSLVLRDVVGGYLARVRGRPPALPARPPYRDYIAWLARQDLGHAEAFWRADLGDFETPTVPDTGRAAPPQGPATHGEHELELPAPSSAALQAFARREQLTLGTLTHGAWAVLLARSSGQDDVLFGSLVSGRPAELAGVEDMIGLFINTLPLRVRVPAAAPVSRWLHELQQHATELRRFQHTPLARLQAWTGVPRGQPLFQSVVVFENYPAEIATPPQERDGAPWSVRVRALQLTNYPLHLMVVPGPRLLLHLTYDRRRIPERAAARLLEHLGALLGAIPEQPAARLGDLPMLGVGERRHLVVDWNQTTVDGLDGPLLAERFQAQARRTPDAVAATEGPRRVGYRELNHRANRLGHLLAARGVGPEQLVALLAERGLDLLTAILGVFKAGGAYLPLDPRHPVRRHTQILAASRPLAVVHAAAFSAAMREAVAALPPGRRPRLLVLEELLAGMAPGDDPPARATPSSLAYVLYTSGSTGAPKGAMVEQRGMVNHLDAKLADLRLDATDRVAQTASQCFDISVWQFLAPLLVGGQVHVVPDDVAHDPARLLAAIQRHAISVLETVPSLLGPLLDAADAVPATRLQQLRWLLSTGEALPMPLCRRWLSTFPHVPMVNAYGPTECSDDVTHHLIQQPPEGDGGYLPIGRPIRNTRLYVLDLHGQPAPVGVAGELYVGGAGVGRGYLHDPAATAAAFLPDPYGDGPGARLYRTGDVVRYLPEGAVEFLGRMDNQVKVRGHRVELGEVEAMLAQHPAVRQAVAAVRAGPRGERRLLAYAVADRPVTAEDLRRFMAARLPEYLTPDTWVLVDALPLTPNGKVDRKALPDPEPTAAPAGHVAPRSATEATIARIWAEVLRVERVGVHDNFFALGGDSILSMQVIARAGQQGLRLTPVQFFAHQTVAELAAAVERAGAAVAEQGAVSGPVPLVPAQRWLLEQDLPRPEHWNMELLLALHERLDATLLEDAARWVVAHHDALRLRFNRAPDGWQQINSEVEAGPLVWRWDVAELDEPARRQALRRAAAELHRGLDLARGPLFRLGLLDGGRQAPGSLLLVAHHLVVDGVSWRVVLEDLVAAYRQLQGGEPVALPPKTTSFREWARRLEELARSPELRAESDWWLAVPRPERLPRDGPGGPNTQGSARMVTGQLGAAETRALLREVPRAFGVQVHEALLTALAQAVLGWAGGPRLLVEVEGHGREELFADVDLARTVGWFTSFYPLALILGGADTAAALRAVREQVRAVPRRGIGYGLLRHLADDPALTRRLAALQPEIAFDYLGQFDQVLDGTPFTLLPQGVGPAKAPEGPRRHVWEVAAGVSDGRLWFAWIYSRALHRRTTMEAVAARFGDALRQLVTDSRSVEVVML
jgi:amino acid adenylation domain-containing protein/non-ribosomal peptide synthase protein (TIGR01720 family)